VPGRDLSVPNTIERRERLVALGIAAAVTAAGAAAAWHYASEGLTLSHYDARAHLVVARRIFDSLIPGWQQIGGVWLPLPHLLNALPVQVDAWYRNGASATVISVLSMGAAAWALATLLMRVTRSAIAAILGGFLLLANPNTLYLQSTPMTEPLLFATTLVSIALIASWLDGGAPLPPRVPGLALMMACMTRYEAWPISAAIVVLAGAVLLRRNMRARQVVALCARLSWYSAFAIFLFAVNSRWTTGNWVVTGDFFVPENAALGQPLLAWHQVMEGLYKLSGTATVWPAWAAALVIAVTFVRSRDRASIVLVLALLGAAAIPWYAYVNGHPLRIRYSLPLVVASVAVTASGVALLPVKIRALAASAIVAASLLQLSPLDRTAPLIAESQRDAVNQEGRRTVTAYLRDRYDGGTIMMSMGSLAHYMHDLSREGFRIHDFLHEGNGDLWVAALALGPRGYVRWVAIEESAEGGDVIFHQARQNPAFLAGFERVAEGGGVALYRAMP
jgi:hypothetical protein